DSMEGELYCPSVNFLLMIGTIGLSESMIFPPARQRITHLSTDDAQLSDSVPMSVSTSRDRIEAEAHSDPPLRSADERLRLRRLGCPDRHDDDPRDRDGRAQRP